MPELLHTQTDTIQLSFEQTVPRSLVHKSLLENVLLTEISAQAADRFVCAGRVPVAHRFFNDAGRTPHTDILFYTELGRQASLAVSHAFLDVSQDDVFIFEGSDAALAPGAWTAASEPSSDAVVVEVHARDITRRRNAVSRVVADHRMWIGSQQVFRGTGAWSIQPAALFERLRRSSAGRAALTPGLKTLETAARLPHVWTDNIVISRPRRAGMMGEFVSSLIVDATHPYFFDHPCDHVPGMLLLEGCAQLATAACRETCGRNGISDVSAYEMTFGQFVECGLPTTLTAQVADAAATTSARWPSVEVSISQAGQVCGNAIIGLAVPTVA